MGKFPLVRILDFVSKVFPFDTLEREELIDVVSRMELAYYPRGEIIIQAGGDPAENLFIIHSGSVRIAVPSESEEEFLIDIRGEGDVFGSVSLLQSRKALFTVTAQEDLLTFLLPADDFKALVARHGVFERHFSLSLARNIRAVWDSSSGHPAHISGFESFREMAVQMRGRVAELMSSNVLTCRPDTSVFEAAEEMTRREVGSIVVANGDGQPIGLVTDTDLRSRVLAAGLSPQAPVSRIMSRPPLMVSPHAFAFEAMLDMTRHGVHHLLVGTGDEMMGVISDHDIKVVMGSTPVGLARNIDKVSSMAELARFPDRIRRVLESLVSIGSSAGYMMDLLSEFMDRLYLKLFELCEKAMIEDGLGPPPSSYSWAALGRAGRKEQAPPFRQDYLLVYGDVPQEREGSVREWFIGFTRRVNEALQSWGVEARPTEKGLEPSSLCRSASAWKETYLSWAADPGLIPFDDPGMPFDFRALQGDSAFFISLRESIYQAVSQNPRFLKFMAQKTAEKKTPLGFFREFVLQQDGSFSDWLDLEEQGSGLLARIIRILALEQSLRSTNTLDRLKEASEALSLSRQLEEDLQEAFNFMTVLWTSRFLEAASVGGAGGWKIDPNGLNMMQRKMLKESFAVINQLQKVMLKRFGHEEQG